jgi:autotransporter strand-loop-strand O-heptosyltransferase
MGNTVPDGVTALPPGPLEEVLRHLQHAALFIGVGSGLAWLAWAAGCPTCLVSGFSLPYTEMADCIRISPPPGVCTGCFNRHPLDAGDWSWCPEHRDTPRMFECTRAITGAQVIAAIRERL